jgi:Fe-S-cluster containining protein
VTGADYERIGEDAESVVTWLGNEAFMRLAGGTHGTSSPRHCIALTANLMTGVFGCSIYERRPQVCRDVERGQGACRFELETKGDRPPRSLALARSTSTLQRGPP